MCSLQLPPQVIKQIDKYGKHYLWSGGDINKKGTYLATGESVTKSKNEGGLGIINLKTQNSALLIKHLDRFYNHADIEPVWHGSNSGWSCSTPELQVEPALGGVGTV